MKRSMKTPPCRATIICDARGRILGAMATMVVTSRTKAAGAQRSGPGQAGLQSVPGTTMYELDIPAILLAENGSLHALVDGYRVRVARGAKPELVARRVGKGAL